MGCWSFKNSLPIINSISILEAIDNINDICKKHDPEWKEWKNYMISDVPRVGDHKYYVTDFSKFKKHYPSWEGITISLSNLLEEMVVEEFKNK